MKRISLFLLAMTLIFMFNGCKDKSDNIASFNDYPTMDRLISQGYDALQNGEYEMANELFRQANERDAFDVRVYDGLGWSYLYINNPALAIPAFGNLEAFGETSQEKANANMGKAESYSVLERHEEAISCAHKVFNLENNYVHDVLNDINFQDLNLVLARAYWSVFQYDSLLLALRSNNLLAVTDNSYIQDQTLSLEVSNANMVDPATGIVRFPLGDTRIVLLEDVTYDGVSGFVKPIGIDYARNEVMIVANPIAAVGSHFTLEFQYVTDFTRFHGAINSELEEQGNLYHE